MKPFAAIAAALFALSSPVLAQEAPKGDLEAGRKKIAMCVGCHGIVGYKSSFPEVFHVPKIAGQSQEYLTKALQAYRAGDRNHPSMRGIAASLSDADIADLAAYYGRAKP